MSKQWYMTVGYPGGELAIKGDDFAMAWEAINADWSSGIEIQFLAGCEDAVHPYAPIVRPCPPDVVEWLEATAEWRDYPGGRTARSKVPGGWMYATKLATVFVPVPGTAGITVLEAGDD